MNGLRTGSATWSKESLFAFVESRPLEYHQRPEGNKEPR
jgi:hypothetical protein